MSVTLDPLSRSSRRIRRTWGIVIALDVASHVVQMASGGWSGPLSGATPILQAGLARWSLFGRGSGATIAVADFASLLMLAGLSLHAALAGQATCGCYGEVVIGPWMTSAFAMAAAALTAPGWFDTRGVGEGGWGRARRETLPVVAAWLLAITFLGAVGTLHVRAFASKAGGLASSDSLDPVNWIDREFALLRAMDLGPILRQGDWIVGLHRRRCTACKEVIAKIDAWARAAVDHESPWVAPGEVPPFEVEGDDEGASNPKVLAGHLLQTQPWRFETPQVVRLRDGRIVYVRCPRHSGQGGRPTS